MSYGIIYKITNIKNNKVYIGQTTKDLNYRKSQHISRSKKKIKHPLYRSIKRDGLKNFKWEIIDFANSKKELYKKEIYWIFIYKSKNIKYGYNLTDGGLGVKKWKPTKENLLNKSIAFTGKNNPGYKEVNTEYAVELRKENKKLEEIAKILKVSVPTLRKRLIENNIDLTPFLKKKTMIDPKKILNLYKSGLSLEEIADKLNLKRSTVLKKLNKTGTKVRGTTILGKNNPSYKDIPIKKIIKLYKKGLSLSELGRRFFVNHHTIKSRIVNPEKFL